MLTEIKSEGGVLVERTLPDYALEDFTFKVPTIKPASETVTKRKRGRPKLDDTKTKVLRRSYIKSDRFKQAEVKLLKLEHNMMVISNHQQQTQLKMEALSRAIKEIINSMRNLMHLK
jgi:hypothetical protein